MFSASELSFYSYAHSLIYMTGTVAFRRTRDLARANYLFIIIGWRSVIFKLLTTTDFIVILCYSSLLQVCRRGRETAELPTKYFIFEELFSKKKGLIVVIIYCSGRTDRVLPRPYYSILILIALLAVIKIVLIK